MDYIYFNNFDCNEMGLDYEAYKDFCGLNDVEPDEENSPAFYEWRRDECDMEWENVECEIKYYDKKHYGHYYVDANLGFWNGREHTYGVFDTLKKAVWACIDNMDYIIIQSQNDGTIDITAIHHDGRNFFTIKKMTDEAYERYDEWKWNTGDDDFNLEDNEVTPIIEVA